MGCLLYGLLVVAAATTLTAGASPGSFYELERNLLQDPGNRYRLLKAFYPPRQAHPVVVKVKYDFSEEQEQVDGSANKSLVWYWSESGFYLIQPLEVFQCTSLLFSNLQYRSRELQIHLPSNCSFASQEQLEMLTLRLKLYAQSPTTSPSSLTLRISDDYIAVAASEEELTSDSLQSMFLKVWLHISILLFPLGSMLFIYMCDPVQLLLGDKTWFVLEDEHIHGTISALIQIAILIIIFIFVMDLAGIYFTITATLISADSHSAFYISTVTGVLIDLLAFVWVLFVFFYSIIYVVKSYIGQGVSLYQADRLAYTRVKKLLTSTVMAAVLSFFNHVHYIILAFIADPFHAGSIAMMFIVYFFIFYFVLRQFYNRIALHSNKTPDVVAPQKLCNKCSAKLDKKLTSSPKKHKRILTESQVAYLMSTRRDSECDCFISGPGIHVPFSVRVVVLSLVAVCPIILLYLIVITTVFFSLPLTKTVEDSPSRLYSIYQGTGLIIVSLLTYNILLRPASFSITKVTERLAKRLRLPEHTNYWNKLTDEEKCAKVVATLMEKHFNSELYKTFSDSDEDSRAESKLEDQGDVGNTAVEDVEDHNMDLITKQSTV